MAELQGRIREVYGIDVSDLTDGLLCEILERIKKEDNRTGEAEW